MGGGCEIEEKGRKQTREGGCGGGRNLEKKKANDGIEERNGGTEKER